MGEFVNDVGVEINILLARIAKISVVDSYERGGEGLKVCDNLS